MHFGRRSAVIAVIAGVTFAGLAPAAAHPVDELLQQVYVTPIGNTLDLDVELTPAAEIAVAFLGNVDRDGDGAISTSEADAHAAAVARAISVVVDGATVPVQLDNSIYPEERLMLAAAGTIVFKLHANLPPSSRQRVVVVTNAYAPTSPSGTINTTVQGSITPRPNSPITLASIDRNESGRTITVRYTDGADRSIRGVSTLTASDKPSNRAGALLVVAGGVLAVAASAVVCVLSRRRRAMARS